MKMSDLVAEYIFRMLDQCGGNVEIKRNELANTLGCVPSQINYVITSRFTPEQGYIVESRRGGGGYIRITRVTTDQRIVKMHIVNSVGDRITSAEASAILQNLVEQGMISHHDYMMISSALSDKSYACIPQDKRDEIRASILKHLLITEIILSEN